MLAMLGGFPDVPGQFSLTPLKMILYMTRFSLIEQYTNLSSTSLEFYACDYYVEINF